LAAYSRAGSKPLVKLPIRFARINGAPLRAAPVEMFCEIAMDVRDHSPFPHTFYFGYTNGWFGYLHTAKAFEEGGYEPCTPPFAPAAYSHMREGVIAPLQGLTR
jgi:neutral ceramidase